MAPRDSRVIPARTTNINIAFRERQSVGGKAVIERLANLRDRME
jgi:hypothetical protein